MVGKELHNRRLKPVTCNIQELFIFITLCSCATAGANMLLFYLLSLRIEKKKRYKMQARQSIKITNPISPL